MKTLALMVVILVLSGCATKGVEMSDDERKACEIEGCTVWTRAELEALVAEAMRRGFAAGQKQKGSI